MAPKKEPGTIGSPNIPITNAINELNDIQEYYIVSFTCLTMFYLQKTQKKCKMNLIPRKTVLTDTSMMRILGNSLVFQHKIK